MVESFLALQLDPLYQKHLAAMPPKKLALWLNQDNYMSVISTKKFSTQENFFEVLLLVKPITFSITHDYFQLLYRHVSSFLTNTLKMPTSCAENLFVFCCQQKDFSFVTTETLNSFLYSNNLLSRL